MNLLPNKQLLPNVPFQSTKYRKKELCVDNKIRETIGDVYCPTCRNEKCEYISTNKTTSFYDCKKFEASCNVLKVPLRTKNRQLCCLAVTVHIVLQERRVATTKMKNHLHFWRNISANHNQACPNMIQKRQKLFHIWYNRVDTPLVDTFTQNFNYILIYTLSVYIKATWFS